MSHRRIRIGCQTAFCACPPTLPFQFALSHEFEAFEWFSDQRDGHGWREDQFDRTHRKQLRELAVDRDVLFTVHAPLSANPLTDEGTMKLHKSLVFAKDVAARVVILHLVLEDGIESFVQSLQQPIETAQEWGLCLSVENIPEHSPDAFNRLFAQLERTHGEAASCVGMCFDMGHANLCPATRNDYIGYFDRLDSQVPISHVHAHENWGDCDAHLPLFTGPAKFDDSGVRALLERLRLRLFFGAIICEQWPDPADLLVEARDRLRALLDDRADLIRSRR